MKIGENRGKVWSRNTHLDSQISPRPTNNHPAPRPQN